MSEKSLTIEEATNFFYYIANSNTSNDAKITRSDLEKVLAVDTNGDGKITDDVQERELPNGKKTTWTEKGVLDENVNKWIKNASHRWIDDTAIDLKEFLEMVLSEN